MYDSKSMHELYYERKISNMDIISLLLLALGLSADAFAVSVTDGICSFKVSKKDALLTAGIFGFFQALMPVLGYILGTTFSGIVNRYQHWIALFLLGAIGVNMLAEAFKEWRNPEETCLATNIFTLKNLIMQGIATSIDALAAGVSCAVLNINIVTSALIIGIITFLLCAPGVYIGKRFGSLLKLRARLVGSVILILLGVKIFIENQFL
jgi:putative Mn2+ efflux pump MntP